MANDKVEQSIFHKIFTEGYQSLWLPLIFAANIFLTGFLLPTETLEAGYTLHHWDFVIAISGALLLLAFRQFLKTSNGLAIACAFLISGVGAALLPYLWALTVLPHGIPDSMRDKWTYSLNGPVAQIVSLALVIGSIRYSRRISNSVAENRSNLNILRRDLKGQIDQERKTIIELILDTVQPALTKIEDHMSRGARGDEISMSINQVISDVVRPLSQQLDTSASKSNYEINPRLIKRGFRRDRIRQGFKSIVPLAIAFNAPLSFFAYLNFNLTTISYIYGFDTAVKVSAPFLVLSIIIFLVFKKYSQERDSSIARTLLANLCISLIQSISISFAITELGPEELVGERLAFAFTTFIFTMAPVLLAIVLHNLRSNLDKESEITSEIAKNLSVIRRQLWALHKRFAREIHGGLQSHLQVFALKFEKAHEDKSQLISDFKSEIKSILQSEEVLPGKEDLQLSLDELAELWDGVANIDYEFIGEAIQSISDDYLIVECVYEVIREAVSNAVKHSGADQISVKVELISPLLLALEVSNNVKKEIKTSSKSNLGTTIYKELSHDWELVVKQDQVQLKATFVLNQ